MFLVVAVVDDNDDDARRFAAFDVIIIGAAVGTKDSVMTYKFLLLLLLLLIVGFVTCRLRIVYFAIVVDVNIIACPLAFDLLSVVRVCDFSSFLSNKVEKKRKKTFFKFQKGSQSSKAKIK